MPFMTTMGLIMGGASAIKGFMDGDKTASAGRRTLNSLRDVDLQNAFTNLKPSLRAEEALFGQSNRRMSQIADVASGMDASSAMGLINASQGNINEFEENAINSMIEKDYQADVLRGQDEVRIQNTLEQRNLNKRAEAISQINTGQQMQTSALEGAASLAISAGNAQAMAAAEGGFESPAAMREQNKIQKLNTRYNKMGGAKDTTGMSSRGIRNLIQGQASTGGTFAGNALRFINPFGGNFFSGSLFN